MTTFDPTPQVTAVGLTATGRRGLPDPLQAVEGTAGPSPLRPERSVRRTSTIDMTWPGGLGSQLRVEGRARDARTGSPAAEPETLRAATLHVGIGDDRVIEEIHAEPAPDGLHELVGCRGGGHLRAALAELVPAELAAGTPLYLLLDDLSGTSLIAGFAWSQWEDGWTNLDRRRPRSAMEGVCIGFAPGSSALVETESPEMTHRTQIVSSLVHPDDPWGWHVLPDQDGVAMRRARRIDVWRDPLDGTVVIDCSFQDSATHPEHGRVAVHEYSVRATADPTSLVLTSVEPTPHVLPFRSCPAAAQTASAVVGTPLGELRRTVLERLARTNGCTHLNDALRALAEVPVLVAQLN